MLEKEGIIIHARDAIADHGRIRITAKAVEFTDEVEELNGKFVCFEVEDTGVGIDPEHLASVFVGSQNRRFRSPGKRWRKVIV